uniref:hydroxymethylglutaryl-CoA lyase n=1 Tax=unclassified Rhodococcus (in: high G+C Gram-positive bacteria) TaxID=192944 RepID=UPI001C3CD6B4|nr:MULTISPECIES: hydroxymethylglutaryl-CoA lyase [unclassified Rhodococcus (in: high G+C Gram-positive bacteria)]
MAEATTVDVMVSEVGPRDGLQNIDTSMPTALKQRWIRALARSGLREIEVGSFVNPKLLPQMADTAMAVEAGLQVPGLTVMALAPNLKGVRAAAEAGVHKVSLPVSASASHSMSNIGMTTEQAVEQVADIVAFRDSNERHFNVEAGISTAFGCTMDGAVSEDHVIRMAVRLVELGADTVGLSDTTGYGNPVQVKRMFARLIDEIGDRTGGAHMHNTRGQGLANVLAALDAGITTFDSSLGGLGGCPYAPGASGNVVTEDLVFLLESMGLRTGVDLDELVAAREIVREAFPDEPLYGHLADAGLPKDFHYAQDRAIA